MPPVRAHARLLAVFVASLLAIASHALAEEATPDPAQLKALERDVARSKAERDRLQSDAATATRALEAVTADMIAIAKDSRDQEYSITLLENQVSDLEREAERIAGTLGRRDAQMAKILLALERLALRPGDAMTLSPLSPDDAVRSAILLRAALPNIKQSAVTLQSSLRELYGVRSQIVAQKEKTAATAASLLEKRGRLEGLVRERSERQVALLARSGEANRRLAKITREAEDLRGLFARLAEEKQRRDDEARAKAAARPASPVPAPPSDPDPRTVVAGVPPASAEKTPPAIGKDEEVTVTRSFAKARGSMPFPVIGTLKGKYGEAISSADEAGLRAKGITIAARAGAQVVAPFDGIVAFAGPFRGYGRLLIIEHSEGYHTLLAGLGRIDCVVGQRVLAGEPVGVMENDGAPALYVELRRDGQPINPLPWLADRTGKSSG